MQIKQHPPVVHFPLELKVNNFVGEVYGYYHPDSNEFNITSWEKSINNEQVNDSIKMIGNIVLKPDNFKDSQEFLSKFSGLVGVRTDQGIDFMVNKVSCISKPYHLTQNIFSRNTGILETDIMIDKCAIISGCGSVGSLVALELTRAGVGKFVLIDNDTIAYHNLCRHQCGIQDVGKFKVNAVRERILQINPSAEVTTCIAFIEEIDKDIFDQFCKQGAIIIGCADNREGDIYASKISCIYNIPFVSIGFWTRAFAGEIFYCLPNEMPCYACAFGNLTNDISHRVSQNRHIYVGEEDKVPDNFEPGISVDINYVTSIGIKLIIDILNKDTSNYIPKLLNHLSQFTLVCNTCDSRIGGEQAEIFSHPLQVTTSINISYSESCPPCKFI